MKANGTIPADVGAVRHDNKRNHQLTLWRFFGVWASIGVQSIGGGAATTLLIQRSFIERYRVVSADEFARLWSISVVTPGINLVAMAVLLGHRAHGSRGIVAALSGLLFPSAAITCGMAAVFSRLAQVAGIQAMMRGIVPATGGVMLVVALNFLWPVTRASALISRRRSLVSGMLVLSGTLGVSMAHLSPIAVLVGSAAVGGLVLVTPHQPKPQRESQDEREPMQTQDGGGR